MATAAKLSLIPDTLDLALYAGDGANIRLTITDNANEPQPIDGEILAQIRRTRLGAEVMAEFAVNLVDGEEGVVFISLTGEQTAALLEDKATFKGVWDVQWQKTGGEPITLLQGKVECGVDVSR